MIRNAPLATLLGILPAVLLAGGAVVCTVVVALRPHTRWSLYRWVGLLMTAAAFSASMFTVGAMGTNRNGVGYVAFGGGLMVDRFAVYGAVVACAILALTLLGAESYMRRNPTRAGAVVALLQLATGGVTLVVAETEIAAITITLTVVATCLVLLTAVTKWSSLTAEAAWRQATIVAIGSAAAVQGMVLIYAATGTTDLRQLATRFAVSGQPISTELTAVGIALVVIGLTAAIGVPPLQQLARQGLITAPGAIAGFATATSLLVAVTLLTRLEVESFGSGNPRAAVLLTVLGVGAALFGGLQALRADSIRRLIGDLATVQAGFLLVAIPLTGRGIDGSGLAGPAAALYLTAAGAVALVGCLLFCGILDQAGLGSTRDDHRGLGRRSRFAAMGLTLSLVALAGLPPSAGFAGRVLVLQSAVDAGSAWAAASAVLGSGLAVFAVLRWLRSMYAEDSEEPPFTVESTPLTGRGTAAATALLSVLLAAFAGPLVALAGGAASALH
ncbi:MAG: NADH-quinone oxidoreductase subunit N [Candidatus Dormibacteria bacterium]